MAGRWSDPSAFRADPTAAPAQHPSRRQTVALFAVLLLVAGAVAIASYVIRPERARAFSLFHGSLFLADQNSPVAVDLASGKPTLRLLGADQQVGITGAQTLGVVPLVDRTLLLNESTGEFNMVDNSGFVVKHDGGGVPLGQRTGASSSIGIATDDGQAYIVRTGATGGTDVYLVSQPTVESAINATKSVTPRASTSMPQAGSTAPGGAASANDELWLLTGPADGRRSIEQLAVPPNSNAGATLTRTNRGTVSGAAAIGTATTGADGTGSTIVGVASAGGIQVFAPGASVRTVAFPAPAGVDLVLPVSNAQGRLTFLLHASNGWNVVSVGADGTGLQAPKALGRVPGTSRLAAPAASNGSVYTVDQDNGQIYRIGADGDVSGVAGAATYPRAEVAGRVIESATFSDAYVIARGSRVVFDSASHANALILFTDGSRAPLAIQKSSAVTVSASGGADALTKTTVNPNQQSGAPPKPGTGTKQPVESINTKIDCQTATQKPHIPVLNPPVVGSRSVVLSWTYPRLSNQDCYPSTYVVGVKLISNNAPQPPSSVRVQSQTGTNLSGLFPSTQYEITVTAYIHGQGTESTPIRITTGKEGPAAPTGLSVSPDSDGNWIVKWNSCGGVQQGCVPAQNWTITPSFCDGRGLASPPAPITKTADPTAREQGPATYEGSDDLLGRGLQFQVEGSGDQGQAGTPSAKSACVTSWAPPVADDMTLSASHPPNTSLGGTTSTKVSLNLGNDPVRAVGGLGAKITFTLTGPGQTKSQSVTFTGRSNDLQAAFTGLQAGATYNATATISPPGHAGSTVTKGPQAVIAAADWPKDLSLTASCPNSFLACDLSVRIHGLSSADADGETFSLSQDSRITCGSAGQALRLDSFDPATGEITASLSQLAGFYGSCTVTIQLLEDNTPTPVFGGQPSPPLSTTFTLGQPTYANAGQNDFTVAWSSNGVASVTYTGNLSDGQLRSLTQNWSESIAAPDKGPQCGTDTEVAGPGSDAAHLGVDADCVNRFGGSKDNWTITVSYDNQVDGSHGPTLTFPLAGPVPGYQPPCTPVSFSATWGDHIADRITLKTSGGDLSGCSNWTYTLKDDKGAVCTPPEDAPNDKPTVEIPISCGTPPADGWTVLVQWVDTAGVEHSDTTVTGTPPKS